MRCPFRLVLTFSRKIPLLFVHSAVCRVVALSTSKHRSIRVKRQECCASASRYGKYYIIERLPSDIRGHAASINDSTLKDFLVKPAQLTLPPDLFKPKESRKNESKSSK